MAGSRNFTEEEHIWNQHLLRAFEQSRLLWFGIEDQDVFSLTRRILAEHCLLDLVHEDESSDESIGVLLVARLAQLTRGEIEAVGIPYQLLLPMTRFLSLDGSLYVTLDERLNSEETIRNFAQESANTQSCIRLAVLGKTSHPTVSPVAGFQFTRVYPINRASSGTGSVARHIENPSYVTVLDHGDDEEYAPRTGSESWLNGRTHGPSTALSAANIRNVGSGAGNYGKRSGAEGTGKLLAELPSRADYLLRTNRANDLLNLATKLLDSVGPDDIVLFWWLQAHLALGSSRRVEHEVRLYALADRVTHPMLTSAYAAAYLPTGALALAQAAFDSRQSPESHATLGFLLAEAGSYQQGLSALTEAYKQFIQRGLVHRSVLCAISIGSVYVEQGNFRAAIEWARKALRHVEYYEVTESTVLLSALNLLLYSSLLIGDHELVGGYLSDASLPSSEGYSTTLEGFLSTLGDYNLVMSNLDEARRCYEDLHVRFSDVLPVNACHGLVRCLVFQGLYEQAESLIRVARDLSDPQDRKSSARLDLLDWIVADARGIQISDSPNSYEELFRGADMHGLVAAEAAVVLSSNALTLYPSVATKLLEIVRPILRHVSPSAWVLFSTPRTDRDKLLRIIGTHASNKRVVRLLGRTLIESERSSKRVSRRASEVLACLALSSGGLTGEQLLLEVFGENGNVSTLKNLLHRSRRYVEISAGPYRINEAISVDAVDLLSRLGSGDVVGALDLYHGPLIPDSDAPGIVRHRERIDEALRQAVVHSRDPDYVLQLAHKMDDDLELWELAEELLPKNDPAYPLALSRVRRIKEEWGI